MCSVISSGVLLHSAWWQVPNDNSNDIFETMDDLPRPFPSCLKSLFQSEAKIGFNWEIRIYILKSRFWILQSNAKSILRVDFNWEIQIWISWISFLPFEIRKKDLQSYSREKLSSFLLIMHARVRPLFLGAIFKKTLSNFPILQWKGNAKTDISALKSLFRISRSFVNTKSVL